MSSGQPNDTGSALLSFRASNVAHRRTVVTKKRPQTTWDVSPSGVEPPRDRVWAGCLAGVV